MFHEVAADPGEHTSEELYERLEAELVAAVEEAGVERVAAESEVEEATLEALVAGESPELTLEEAAAIRALSRDALMMGMSQAVLDVEALAAETGGELEAREVQSKIEGRYPMTLREFALLHATIQSRVR